MTTFARLALVVQGKIKPCDWIERAFATLASAVSHVLPDVGTGDKNKYLHTNPETGSLEWDGIFQVPAVSALERGMFLGSNESDNSYNWKTIRQVPAVENADKGKYLHANDSTGALEWREAGGTPKILVVSTEEINDNTQLTKTWQEIFDADYPVLKQPYDDTSFSIAMISYVTGSASHNEYRVITMAADSENGTWYRDVWITDSPNGKPVYDAGGN